MDFSGLIEQSLGLPIGDVRPGLTRIRRLLDVLGNPQNDFPSVHITGSNGKGSTAKMTESILRHAGMKTGLYLSPHVCVFNERIQVAGKPAGDGEILFLFQEVRRAVETNGLTITFFEFVTAMAFLHFRQERVEVGVIEVGMGGALDATNVIRPEVSIILDITVEHTEYLGPDLATISAEKCGIISPGVPVVALSRNQIVVDTIARITRTTASPVFQYGKDFGPARVRSSLDGTEFDFRTGDTLLSALGTRLAGEHQAMNASAAVQASLILREKGLPVSPESIRAGLLEATLPGRFERVFFDPLTICDGAHNPAAVRALTQALGQFFEGERFSFLVGILRHKNEKAILRILSRVARRFVFVRPTTPRAIPPEELKAVADSLSVPATVIPSVGDGLRHLLEKGESPICVTGSFYTVGEVERVLQNLPAPPVALTANVGV